MPKRKATDSNNVPMSSPWHQNLTKSIVTKVVPSVYTSCPACGRLVPSHSLSAHVSFHTDLSTSTGIASAGISEARRQSSPSCRKVETVSQLDSRVTQIGNAEQSVSDQSSKSINPQIPSISSDIFSYMVNSMRNISAYAHICFAIYLSDGKILPQLYYGSTETSGRPVGEKHWSAEVDLKHHNVKLRIVTNIDSSLETYEPSSDDDLNRHSAVLKSMLQKAIRRRYADKAAGLCDTLLKLNINNLLRRIPVICMEDAVLHPALPLVVWLMVAVSKGYRPPTLMLRIVTLFCAELALTQHRDVPFTNELPMTNLKQLPEVLCEPSSLCLVATVLLRAAYGGMGWDVEMLKSYSSLWISRFSQKEDVTIEHSTQDSDSSYMHSNYIAGLLKSNWGTRCVKAYETIENSCAEVMLLRRGVHALLRGDVSSQWTGVSLCPEHLIPEGIDFHCDGQLINYVISQCSSELYFFLDENISISLNELVKKTIWEFRSSINYHLIWDNDFKFILNSSVESNEKYPLLQIWKIIDEKVESYCARKVYFLKRDMHNKS